MIIPDDICAKGSKQESTWKLRNMIVKPEAECKIT